MINQFSGCSLKWIRALSLLLIVISANALAIDTPPNPRGTVNGSTVTWEWNWVPGVDQYEVTIDGQIMPLVRDPRFVSNNLWVGEHSMRVRAISASWDYSAPTNTVQVIVGADSAPQNNTTNNNEQPSNNQSTNRQLSSSFGAPANPRGSQTANGTVQWEWDAVSGATNYEVVVDGAQYHTTSETRFTSDNLWNGEHSMSVRAISSDWRYSEQSNTVKVIVSENGSNQDNNPQPVVANNNSQPSNDPGNPPPNDNGLVDPLSWTIPEASRDGYELVFSDEFNGYAVNPARWNTQLRWDGEWNGERYEYRVINGEDQFYVNTLSPDWEHRDRVVPLHNPFEFDGNRLAIRAVRNPLNNTRNGNRDHGRLQDILPQQPFLSGAMATYDKFSQKYGYFEARMKISNATGSFPAFWLHHQNQRSQGTARTEIDIMENLGHAPWYVYNSFHYFTNVSTTYGGDDHSIRPYPQGQISNGTDFSEDYHTYAVEWSPGYVQWFIDGQRVSEVWNSNVDREDLYIIMNLAIGGNWTNYPTNSGGLGRASNDHFPNDNDMNQFPNPALEIDWVRAYRRR